jgi:hypothetical protein
MVHAIWRDGQVVLTGSADWPEGCRLIVQEDRLPAVEFMSEAEQSNDPDSIQQWIDELRAIPAVPCDSSEEAEWRAWEETLRHHNLEAVRQQFEEGHP